VSAASDDLESTPLRWDREGEILDAVASVAAGTDLRTILERMVRGAVELVGGRYGAMGVMGDDGALVDFIHIGIDDATAATIGPLPTGRGVLGVITSTTAPMRLDDLTKHPASVGFPDNHPPMHSFVGAPVRLRGESFGTLYVTEKLEGSSFTEADARTLAAFAGVAGIAVENSRLFERSRRREEWLRASTEVTTAILSGADTETVLDIVARRALSCARADGVAIMLENDDHQMVVEVALGDASDGFTGMVADETWSFSMRATQSGRPVVIDDLGELGKSTDPAYQRLGAAMLLPLIAEDRRMGAIAVTRFRGGPKWDEQDVAFAEAFAGQTALALVLADAQREQERLAVFVDRDRIARDLHDLVIQRLFATGMTLQGARRRGEVPEALDARIDAVIEDLDATVREIRTTIFALNSSEGPTTMALRARVLREVALAGTALGFQPRVTIEGPVDAVVVGVVADHTIAALREAMSNVARHAHASQIEVALELSGDDIVLVVTDDGVGIFPGSRRSGLRNLVQRAEELGGSCVVEPTRKDGSGTRLTWRASIL